MGLYERSDVGVKRQKLLADNVELKQWLRQMAQKEKKQSIVENEPPTGIAEIVDKEDFTGYIPEDHFIQIGENLDEALEVVHGIAQEQMKMVRLLKKHGKPKHWANRILLVCDDMVGSVLFKRTGYFTGLNTRHRHYSLSMIMVSQAYKEIQKTVRTNWTSLLIYGIGNEKEVEVIYEEYSMGLDKNTWHKIYDHCTKDEHGFMFINYQQPRHMRIMKNFDNVIWVEKEEAEKRKRKIEEEQDVNATTSKRKRIKT